LAAIPCFIYKRQSQSHPLGDLGRERKFEGPFLDPLHLGVEAEGLEVGSLDNVEYSLNDVSVGIFEADKARGRGAVGLDLSIEEDKGNLWGTPPLLALHHTPYGQADDHSQSYTPEDQPRYHGFT
jgi:hypothetical protein